MTKIIVTGIGGRMGTHIAEIVRKTDGLKLESATERPGSFAVDTLLPEGHPVVDDLAKCIERGDVIIDFTSPEATLKHAALAQQHQKAMVIGTTGFNDKQKQELTEILKTIPSVWAPNMSIGVNVLLKLVEQTAQILGEDYDMEIVEAHHRHKVDAPSGTALALAEAAAKGASLNLDKVACYERHGQVGPRKDKEIGIQTLRGGDIVGDHTVMFAGIGERVELSHRAGSRDNFVRGAVKAAQWVHGQAPGIYGMGDVLGL